ncbi:oligosaccharide repeat unit polymerase [Clostridium taeniosporum]|uniref:O-antigen ligase domain-containing protein n=1 Tax=Clostridium taeniosporum TaxID=394958 RepID=A0A1D7XN32_9CLOT|nr:oligosaccharide repeat unit polymerase [Clostridium taeniosporum]AOR24748.1 hypothetical protein BGI42_13850 [Clostridium taeniosporum]
MIKNNIFITIMMFLFVFNIPFTFLPFGTAKLFTIMGIVILFIQITMKKKSMFFNNKEAKFCFKYSLFLLIGSIFFTLIHNTFDFTITYSYFLFIIEHLLGSLTIIYLINKKNSISIEYVLRRIVSICFIQSCLVILMLISEKIKIFIYSILKTGESLYDMGLRYDGIRGLGVASNTTYELSFVLSIGLIIDVYLINKFQNNKEIFKLSLSYLVICFATIVTARTGLIGVFISFLILVINYKKKYKECINIRKIKFILFLFIICFISIVFLNLIFSDFIILVQEKIIPFAFEAFINLFRNKSFEMSSTNVLKQMYFPVSFKTLIIGDGRYINENGIGYYMSTDAGYMRHLLFSGIFSVFLYDFYFKIFNKIKNNIKYLNYKRLNIIISFLAVYYFLVHAKGDLLTGGNMAIKVLVLIYLASGFESKNLKIKQKI